jgi:hypothetical protein
MPGVYDIGSSSVVMQEYVDIEGSGENVTKIIGNTPSVGGVIQGTSNSEIRFLTAENTGGSTNTVAIGNIEFEIPRLRNVTAIASGGVTNNYGINFHGGTGAPVLIDVVAIASGGANSYGIFYEDLTPSLTNVRASASGSSFESFGLFDGNDTGGHSTIEHSVISGNSGSIKTRGFGSAFVASSRLEGSVVNADSNPGVKCAGVYDASFTFFPNTCP